MQDRQNPKIEDQFIDKAWSDMATRLDEVLPIAAAPVAPSNINRSLWLLFFSFLTGLGVGIVAQYTLSDKPIAEVQFEGDNQESEINWKDVTSVSPVTINNSSATVTSLPVTVTSSDYILDAEPILLAVNNIGALNIQPDSKQLLPLEQEEIKLLESTLEAPQIEIKISNEKQESIPGEQKGSAKRVIQSPGVGLIAGMNVFRTSLFGGYYGGLIADYPISSNIVLHAGITYSLLKEDISVRYSPVPLERQNTFGNKNTTSYVSLNEMHYLNLPLELSYQPFKFVRFNSGVSFSYLVDTDADMNSANASNFALNAGSSLNKSFEQDAWRNWDISLTYGLSLFPAPNWGLDFNYNVGLMDFTSDNDFNSEEETLHRQYQISVLYYFYRQNQKGN